MIGAKPYSTPSTSSKRLTKFDGEPLEDQSLCRHIVGVLQYCTLTRPDISFSLSHVCQFLHCPTTTHFTVAKRVLRYLKGTPDYCLTFTKGLLQLEAFCDSDWAGDPIDWKSTSGYGVFLSTCLISWQSKRQPTTFWSSTEAKYRFVAIATAELHWLCMLLKEMRVSFFSPPNF